MSEPVEMESGVVTGPDFLDPEQRNQAPDEYHTCCRGCGETKVNGLFTPGELKRKRPRCRVCVYEAAKPKYQRPGVKPGYGWRGAFWPEKQR